MAENLMDGLFSEMNRVREIIKEYESIGEPGFIACAMMKQSIAKAEKSIRDNDVVQMLFCYKDLQEYTT